MVAGAKRNRRVVGLGGALLVGASCAGPPETVEPPRLRSPEAARLAALPGPVRLVGMRAEAVDALLGRPELQRQERRALYRRYDVDGCALDLYLYESATNGDAKVAWFEVRPVDPLMVLDPRACGWLEERLGAPSASESRAAEAPS